MTSSLTGKTAVVTGGAKGIGAAVVRRFTADGANVVIADIDGVNGRKLAEACGRALFVPCDVSQEEQVLAVLDAAESQFGPVDILVNDAAWQLNKPLLETTTEEFERVMGDSLFSGPVGVDDVTKKDDAEEDDPFADIMKIFENK